MSPCVLSPPRKSDTTFEWARKTHPCYAVLCYCFPFLQPCSAVFFWWNEEKVYGVVVVVVGSPWLSLLVCENVFLMRSELFLSIFFRFSSRRSRFDSGLSVWLLMPHHTGLENDDDDTRAFPTLLELLWMFWSLLAVALMWNFCSTLARAVCMYLRIGYNQYPSG